MIEHTPSGLFCSYLNPSAEEADLWKEREAVGMKPMAGMFLGAFAGVVLLAGCQAAQKTMPHIGAGSINLQAGLERKDLVVMKNVKGQSKTVSILFGAVQFIDDGGLRVLGVSFFKDKYTFFKEPNPLPVIGVVLQILGGVSPEDRAYYKALEEAQEADFVLVKSMDREEEGFGPIYNTTSVTFRGKAMQVKSD